MQNLVIQLIYWFRRFKSNNSTKIWLEPQNDLSAGQDNHTLSRCATELDVNQRRPRREFEVAVIGE